MSRLLPIPSGSRQAGNLSDGVIARRQLAEVLVHNLRSQQALRKTFELVATKGPVPEDFAALFAGLEADKVGALDGVRDMTNMTLDDEPRRVRDDLDVVLARRSGGAS